MTFIVESVLKFLACTGEDLVSLATIATDGSIELTKFTTDVEVMRRVKVDNGLVGEVLEKVWFGDPEGEAGKFIEEGFGTGHDRRYEKW